MPETLVVLAPISGSVVPLSDVPDPVFAGQMVGSGAAVEPPAGESFDVVSPVAGKVVKLLPHAFVVVESAGRGVLTHVGIDTVKLKGEGFKLLIAQGDTVGAGESVMHVDPAAALAAGYSMVSPVVVLDTKPDTATLMATGAVTAGAGLFSLD
ncbi:PTS glucose transporter subunit IIA [Arthrobacter sp. PGP41]|uniref:PTS sugar transporter subunit IIA n=1 Tax=unclassified Arthrobacter TaxID=235627 RepID=UPI000CDBCF0A|nr:MULTISPECIES: glucose PTS transporter subunit IIA [unclassified Arthrobacter]AUZ36096.1 PTS glucose transporter subunit IIA [Arthrobacter sp. PGP41]MDT0194407.1 glucose PTS transporter subunit IIA [Arthrobacter sp. AB6]